MNLTDEQEGRFLNCLSRYGVSITYGAQYSVRCQIGQIMSALNDFIAEPEPSAPEPSGVEWRDPRLDYDEECIEQLQQVCTEQAERIAALEKLR